jgi:ABC-type arginine transport system permease subunit
VLRQTIDVDPFAAGSVALGVIFGAYATEIFRGAILAVPKGQVEAAEALGLSQSRVYSKVILPQAWRLALPPYGNQLVVLLKQTSLVSVVGLEEVMRKANIAAGATNQPFTFYLAAAIIYLTMTGTLSAILFFWERSAARGLVRR